MTADLPSKLNAAAARWNNDTTPLASGFSAARAAAHWAVQVVAAAGATLAPPRPDHSHTSLEWAEDGGGVLAGVPVGPAAVRAALRLAELTLQVHRDGVVSESLPLAGHTVEAALLWLAEAIARQLGVPARPLECPHHDLPAHAVAAGAPWSAPDPASAQLVSWFGSADRLLRALTTAIPGASPVRCWPHHFDIGTLIALDAEATPAARSIGVGLSPGDASYDEPYWYVTPFPHPPADRLSPLPAGHWHTQGWVGAVLPASALTGDKPGEQVVAFVAAAIAAGRRILTS
jgi:hypothetical protein